MISYNFHIPQSETSKEVARFRASVEKSRRQLERMQAELRQSRIPESSFLVDAHLLILQDKHGLPPLPSMEVAALRSKASARSPAVGALHEQMLRTLARA